MRRGPGFAMGRERRTGLDLNVVREKLDLLGSTLVSEGIVVVISLGGGPCAAESRWAGSSSCQQQRRRKGRSGGEVRRHVPEGQLGTQTQPRTAIESVSPSREQEWRGERGGERVRAMEQLSGWSGTGGQGFKKPSAACTRGASAKASVVTADLGRPLTGRPTNVGGRGGHGGRGAWACGRGCLRAAFPRIPRVLIGRKCRCRCEAKTLLLLLPPA